MMFWDPDAGTLLKTLERHPDHREPIHSVSFSNDGKALMSASNKAGVLVWSFDLEGLLVRGCEHLHDYLETHPQNVQLCSGPKSR